MNTTKLVGSQAPYKQVLNWFSLRRAHCSIVYYAPDISCWALLLGGTSRSLFAFMHCSLLAVWALCRLHNAILQYVTVHCVPKFTSCHNVIIRPVARIFFFLGGGGGCVPQEPGPNILMFEWYAMQVPKTDRAEWRNYWVTEIGKFSNLKALKCHFHHSKAENCLNLTKKSVVIRCNIFS